MTLTLTALAAAIWLSGRPRSRGDHGQQGRHGPPPRPRPTAGRLRPSALPLVAAAAVGLACLVLAGPGPGTVVAVVAAPTVGVVIRAVQRRQRTAPPAREVSWLPLILDLISARLIAGQPLGAALTGVAPPQLPWLDGHLRQVAALLRLGADPAEAWAALADQPRLRPLAVTAVRSATSGIRLAASLRELASEVRADDRAEATARAQRAGVWVMAPLGLCFLPAFVCLGIVPVLIGIAGTLRGGLLL